MDKKHMGSYLDRKGRAQRGCRQAERSTQQHANVKEYANHSTDETPWLIAMIVFVLFCLLAVPRLMAFAHMSGWF